MRSRSSRRRLTIGLGHSTCLLRRITWLTKKDPFQVDLTVEQAIRIIQKNERGRIGIQRAVMVSDWRHDAMRKEERQRRVNDGKGEGEDLLESQVLAATRIA